MTIINKGFHQWITRKYAFVPQHRRKFPALFYLVHRFKGGQPLHYLVLKKKYITVLPQVLNRVYSFNFQRHCKFHFFSRQYNLHRGLESMHKQVNVLHGSALSTDISHISHISHGTWVQHALWAMSQVDLSRHLSETQTTPRQENAAARDTIAGTGFLLHVKTTLTGIEKETFEIARRLIAKSSREQTISNNQMINFNTSVESTISRAKTKTGRAPTFTVNPAAFVGVQSVFVFALNPALTPRYPIPVLAEGTTVFTGIKEEKSEMVQELISKSHTAHTHINHQSISRANTKIGRAPTFTVDPAAFAGTNLVLTQTSPSMVFSYSRAAAHAPVLSPAQSEFFQTVTKRMETTLSTIRNSQNYALTTLHVTSRTSEAKGTPGKAGPKPPTPPQLDYFTPVGTFQPKTETSLAEREDTTVTSPGAGSISSRITDNQISGKIPAIPGINSAAVSNPQEGSIDFDRLTDRVYRMLESKITMEKEMRGW